MRLRVNSCSVLLITEIMKYSVWLSETYKGLFIRKKDRVWRQTIYFLKEYGIPLKLIAEVREQGSGILLSNRPV